MLTSILELQQDKVIVTSNHIKNIFENTACETHNQFTGEKSSIKGCSVPVEVVNYPVKTTVPADISGNLNLSHDFNFLTVAQVAPRKNLFATIEWFIQEFHDEDIGLVVKSHLMNNSTVDRLQVENMLKSVCAGASKPNRKCKIYHIHGLMTEEEMHGLYVHPQIKCLVSTTHGEGFGLPLFEAAYSGLPIVAPVWSGQSDFVYMPKKKKGGKKERICGIEKVKAPLDEVAADAYMPPVIEAGMKWCYPDKDKFKKALRAVFDAYSSKERRAQQLKEHLCKTLSLETQQEVMCEAIRTGYENETQEWQQKNDEVVIL